MIELEFDLLGGIDADLDLILPRDELSVTVKKSLDDTAAAA